MASVILRMIVDTEIFSIKMIRAIPMPTSIKEAYYKYCYGIFLNKLTYSNNLLKKAKLFNKFIMIEKMLYTSSLLNMLLLLINHIYNLIIMFFWENE